MISGSSNAFYLQKVKLDGQYFDMEHHGLKFSLMYEGRCALKVMRLR